MCLIIPSHSPREGTISLIIASGSLYREVALDVGYLKTFDADKNWTSQPQFSFAAF